MAKSRRVKIKGRWHRVWSQAKSAVNGRWVTSRYAAMYPHLTMWITRRMKAPA